MFIEGERQFQVEGGGGRLGWEKSTEASTGGFLLSVVTIVDNSNLILDRLWRSSGVVKA